jgi:hypothetical protein
MLGGNQEVFKNLDLRTTIGVAILASLSVVFLTGFVAHSQRDVHLILSGYVLGILAVWLNDRMKARHSKT